RHCQPRNCCFSALAAGSVKTILLSELPVIGNSWRLETAMTSAAAPAVTPNPDRRAFPPGNILAWGGNALYRSAQGYRGCAGSTNAARASKIWIEREVPRKAPLPQGQGSETRLRRSHRGRRRSWSRRGLLPGQGLGHYEYCGA